MVDKVEAVTRDAIEKGGVLAQLYFDVHGTDKEAVEGMLIDLSKRLSGEKGVIYAVGDIDRAMEVAAGQFSAAARIVVLTKNFQLLSLLCAYYGPLGIEILKPMEIRMNVNEAQQLLFDNAKMSFAFTQELIEKTMTPEELRGLKKKLEARGRIGNQLIEKGGVSVNAKGSDDSSKSNKSDKKEE